MENSTTMRKSIWNSLLATRTEIPAISVYTSTNPSMGLSSLAKSGMTLSVKPLQILDLRSPNTILLSFTFTLVMT